MDKLILKAKSKYDLKVLIDFNRYNLYSSLQARRVTILSIILIIFGIISSDFSIGLRILTVLVGVVWIVELLVLPKLNAKKVLKSSKISSEADVEFEFYEDKVLTKTIKDEKEMARGELNYKDLYKVVDLKEYIYLYIASNQAFICSKDNLDGNYNELSEVLKSTLCKKYKIKYRR